MADDERGDAFLARWSRRKQAARRGEATPEPVVTAPPPGPAAPASEPPAELPPIDALKGLESDYRAFMSPQIDAATRSAALRRLFSDPHFNVMDGLDVYIDDYSVEDPIPPALLRILSGARTLGLFDADEEEQSRAAAAPVDSMPAPDPSAALEAEPNAAKPAAQAASEATTPEPAPRGTPAS